MTADEKREADRIKRLAAVEQIAAQVATPEWVEEQMQAFFASRTPAYAGKDKLEIEFPAGEEFQVGRLTVDEGKARAHAVIVALDSLGIRAHSMMGFGLHAGRSSVTYSVEMYADA